MYPTAIAMIVVLAIVATVAIVASYVAAMRGQLAKVLLMVAMAIATATAAVVAWGYAQWANSVREAPALSGNAREYTWAMLIPDVFVWTALAIAAALAIIGVVWGVVERARDRAALQPARKEKAFMGENFFTRAN